MSQYLLTDGHGSPEGGAGTDVAPGWRELVEQIELLEELIADVRAAGDGGGEFLLAELHRLLSRRRCSLRAHLEARAGEAPWEAAD